MDWMFEDFKTELDKLNPTVREKVLEIAKTLVQEKGLSEKEAIQKGITKAEGWFYDLGG